MVRFRPPSSASSSSSYGGGEAAAANAIDALAAPDAHPAGALLRRVGLSVLASNDEFDKRSREDAAEYDAQLQELRRKAKLQAAQCMGQLDVVAKEARAEEERRLVSERVARELEAFRDQQQRREAQEDDRIAHLYRALLEPAPAAAPHAAAYYSGDGGGGAAAAYYGGDARGVGGGAGSVGGTGVFRANGGQAFPPVIYSAVNLLQDDRSEDCAGAWSRPVAVVAPAPPRARHTVAAKREHAVWLDSLDEAMAAPAPSREGYCWKQPRLQEPAAAAVAAAVQGRSSAPRHRRRIGAGDVAESSPTEAHALLRTNLARLERLERLGL